MRMRFFAALLLIACKLDVTEEVQALEKRACECASKKDATCGKAVLAELAKLSDAKNVKADEQKAAASAKALATCLLESGVTSLEIHSAINKPEPVEPAAPAESPK
ncbi:MAG: hypothetical protein H0V17_10535 [Deltaproteobacteria bacterium]|nr:hypothetical protein [Deltaproteobacteria bacterium]